MMMNYEEAVSYLNDTPRFTVKNSLDHTRECLRRLGDPQKNFRVIHVAGTNGKGSTCAYLDSVLRTAGYRTGLFTSPHLVRINERFVIDGREIGDDLFLEVFHQVKDLADQLVREGSHHPTYFEMLFLMGMVIFARERVQVVVLETGLGGRLDATTAVEDPLCCVITSISFDHMQYLGNTIREIAGEKAGIIVPGVPVIYDGNNEEAAEVIKNVAGRQKSPAFCITGKDAQVYSVTREGITFSFEGEEYHIPFIARYQVMNACLAVKALEVLKEDFPVTREQVKTGLTSARWPGRMETLMPGVIADGAHNRDGVEKFVETAGEFQTQAPLTLLFSAVEDKDYEQMIRTITENLTLSHVVTTQVGGERQVDAEKLGEIFRENGCGSVESFPTVPEALSRALELKGEDGMVFCAGSLYLVGELKAALEEERHD